MNLENSGRELESIVVGEIQKAYNAYAGILKREADEAYETVESLRTGPVQMPKDNEWDAFVSNNDHFVDPRMPIRKPELVHYPGKDAPAAAEVRAGMLERKSKYLKSYTPGWLVSVSFLSSFLFPTRLNHIKQVRLVANSSARVQIGRSLERASTRHVLVSPGTKARISLGSRLVLSQVHAQRSSDWWYAPWPRLGFPSRIARYDARLVRRHQKPHGENGI